jgi:hypothetical protein
VLSLSVLLNSNERLESSPLIKILLSKIIGLQLTKSTRSSQLECLKFGIYEKIFRDGVYNLGEFGLHLQTTWRL